MTIFVTWQLRATLDSIRNSCNVLSLASCWSIPYPRRLTSVSMLRVGGFILLAHHNSSTMFGTIFSSNLNFALLLAFHPVKPPYHNFGLCKACNTILFAQRDLFCPRRGVELANPTWLWDFLENGLRVVLEEKTLKQNAGMDIRSTFKIGIICWVNLSGCFYFCQRTEIEFAETKLYTHTNNIWKWNKWIKITASIWIFKTPKKVRCYLSLNPHEPPSLLVTKGGNFWKQWIPSLNQ